jgi:hypothetical protein
MAAKLQTRWGITGYENDPDDPVWTYSSPSESGAISLAKTMQKIGSTILSKPVLDDHGLWKFEFTNPLNRNKFDLPK